MFFQPTVSPCILLICFNTFPFLIQDQMYTKIQIKLLKLLWFSNCGEEQRKHAGSQFHLFHLVQLITFPLNSTNTIMVKASMRLFFPSTGISGYANSNSWYIVQFSQPWPFFPFFSMKGKATTATSTSQQKMTTKNDGSQESCNFGAAISYDRNIQIN